MNAIPEITNELGKHWQQPRIDEILLDDTHALMGKSAFDNLLEYSTSIPSGVYVGKMWKGRYKEGGWYLAWFSKCEDPKFVNNNYREILLLDS